MNCCAGLLRRIGTVILDADTVLRELFRMMIFAGNFR